jgi:hypothetical protein
MNKEFTQTIHSDFLIHWTGCDIDKKLDPHWNASNASTRMRDNVVEAYIDRLKNILKFGFWMTKANGSEKIRVNEKVFVNH